jgi:hypothetical protein
LTSELLAILRGDALAKDREYIPLPISADDSDLASGPKPFAPEQMIPCEHCLRQNPPTRVSCLYCGAVLPLNETSFNLQKPTLRRLEQWELGYNNILVPSANAQAEPEEIDYPAVADLLKLSVEDLRQIIPCSTPLPLAHAASPDEATLVERRLASLKVNSRVVADSDLGVTETGPVNLRGMNFHEAGFSAFQSPDLPALEVKWSDLVLIVKGRIVSTRVELKEQRSSREGERTLDSSEFFSDEVVVELHTESLSRPFRVSAHSFDFSCLGPAKGLVAGENMNTLIERLCEGAPQVVMDEEYKSLRKLLEPVWPTAQQNQSIGWKRERPGKYTIGSAAVKNNETQFMRYSLLRIFLVREERREK